MKSNPGNSAALFKYSSKMLGFIYIFLMAWTSLWGLAELYRFKIANSIDIFPQDVLPDHNIQKVITKLNL